jgi:raffinose/stachyose/melibiose transport system permease protein
MVPFVHSVWLSFFSWNGMTPAHFVGTSNYSSIFGDSVLLHSFIHAFELIVFFGLIPTLIGLFIAGILARTNVRGFSAISTILFLPKVIALTAVAVAWRELLAPNGLVNAALQAVGLGSLTQPWLGSFTWALPSVGLMGTWVSYGLAMVLFIAGVQRIPLSLYDAARVDGAGALHEFLTVTLPGLRNEMVVALLLTTSGALSSFDLVYVATSGGPGTSTLVPAYYIYSEAFLVGQIGAAAAMGVLLAALIFVIAFAITRLGDR